MSRHGLRVAPLRGARGKRALDLVGAAVLLVALSPLLGVLWALVRLTSPGPVVFRQRRLGLGERPFTMYKFRSMHTGCDDRLHRHYVEQLLTADQPAVGGTSGLFKLDSDPRVTRVGAWLRRTSLDELPQLVNVLRGEMSLVGPRPVLSWEAELFGDQVRDRFAVRPGITGLWQVSGRGQVPMRRALELDVEYVHRQSLRLDLSILLRTLLVPVRRGTA